MYQCGYCIFKSKRKYNLKIHEERNHINLKNKASSNIQNQHNTQYGNGQNTHHNGDYNKVVEIAHGWKQQCQVKDNAIRVRDNFLTANNSKLQDEITKNRILIEQNRNIIEINNELVLEKENLISDGNDKLSAMGEDMGKVIRKNKHLKRKNRALNNYSRWKRIHKGSGVKKKFFKTKAPTTLKVGRGGPLAPSTISVFNNGEKHYRGEKGVHFKSAEFLQRNRGIGGMLKRM